MPAERAARRSGNPARSSGAPALGRRTYQKGLQTFVWKADDDNDDELSFDVFYRREGETAWKLLEERPDRPHPGVGHDSVPNGTYVIEGGRLGPPSNPRDTALDGELESGSFEIDNTPPAVTLGALRARRHARRRARSRCAMPIRAVTRVEYSLDAQRWQPAFSARRHPRRPAGTVRR